MIKGLLNPNAIIKLVLFKTNRSFGCEYVSVDKTVISSLFKKRENALAETIANIIKSDSDRHPPKTLW